MVKTMADQWISNSLFIIDYLLLGVVYYFFLTRGKPQQSINTSIVLQFEGFNAYEVLRIIMGSNPSICKKCKTGRMVLALPEKAGVTNHQQLFFDQLKSYLSVRKITETREVCPDAFGKEALEQINRKKSM